MTDNAFTRHQTVVRQIESIQEKIKRLEASILTPRGQLITDEPNAQSIDFDTIGRVYGQIEELQARQWELLGELCKTHFEREKALNRMAPLARKIYTLKHRKGLSWKEVRKAVGEEYTVEGLRKKLRRAMKRINNCEK